MNINLSSILNSIPGVAAIRERHLPAMASLAKKIPFPSIGSSLLGRVTSDNVMNFLYLGLITFVLFKIFRKSPEKPQKPPVAVPPAAPQKEKSARPPLFSPDTMGAAVTPIHGNMVGPASQNQPSTTIPSEPLPLQTPHKSKATRNHALETPETTTIDGDRKVLELSHLPPEKVAISISSTTQLFECREKDSFNLNDIFKEESFLYVNNAPVTLDELKANIQSQMGSPNMKKIINLLMSLNEIGNQCLRNSPDPTLSLEDNVAIHCSISKNQDGPIVIIANNLFYTHEGNGYQLWLDIREHVNSQGDSNKWAVSCFCTLWMGKLQHPLTFDKRLTKDFPTLPTGIQLPLWKNHVCIDSVQLTQDANNLELSETLSTDSSLNPIFKKEAFVRACGNKQIWAQLNNLSYLLDVISSSLPPKIRNVLGICGFSDPIILKTSKADTVFALFSILTKGKPELYEIGIYLQLTEKGYFPKKYFCQFKGGFYREMKEIQEETHPLLMLFPEENQEEYQEDSVLPTDVFKHREEVQPDSMQGFGRTPIDDEL